MSSLLDYKCPACGGTIKFDSSLQMMKCPYCDTVLSMEEMLPKDEVLTEDAPGNSGVFDVDGLPKDSFNWDENSIKEWDENETDNISVFVCNSCGGEIIGDNNTAATECPYCGNQVVVVGRFKGALKPDYVIPFKLDKNAAKERYKQHISGKFLLPKLFKDENHIDEIKGIYVPFWLFSSKVDSFARFDAEKVRTWISGNYKYTEVSTFDVFRSGKMQFMNIPVDGSQKMPDDLMESIEPFDFRDAVPFQTAYLSGFFADKYDVDDKTSEKRANERVRQSTIDVFRSTVSGYTSVRSFSRDLFNRKYGQMQNASYEDPFANTNSASSGITLEEGTVSYALYPVYLLSTTYEGQKFTFAMNGQTGKFVGDLPVDKTKKRITFAGIFAAATAVCTLILQLLAK
ncbi:MAG: hypothetical protein J6036_03740 [Clostridia bacterium]|nr:hypothetical protein [Clostridia bacterium]